MLGNILKKLPLIIRLWECKKALEQLEWEPGYVGIKGNEIADQLARNGASTPFIGPETVLGITKGAVREDLRDWI
uniref:RNase H domain-containing protein n=1 Tax=Rhodnius prolixus TaxID=13249 RepID=T1HDR1_RHOPR